MEQTLRWLAFAHFFLAFLDHELPLGTTCARLSCVQTGSRENLIVKPGRDHPGSDVCAVTRAEVIP